MFSSTTKAGRRHMTLAVECVVKSKRTKQSFVSNAKRRGTVNVLIWSVNKSYVLFCSVLVLSQSSRVIRFIVGLND